MFSSLLQRLRNASVARKIDLILFPPLLIMVLLVTLLLSRMLGQMGDARTAEHVIALSAALSEVAHNHAVERGLTAGFLASKGHNTGDKLAAQRLKADTATSDLKRAIDSRFVRGLTQQHRERLDELVSELEYLPALRREVDALDDSNTPFDVYSGINKMALDISGELSTLIQDISLVNAVHSLNGLLWLIERSGQERGALNGVFTRGDYSLTELLTVNKYVEDQNAQLDYIARNMDSEAFVEVMDAMSSDANMQVLELRQAFFTAANNQGEMPSDAPTWFALSTERIKAIKQVANSQTITLAATAGDKMRNSAILFVALSVMAVLLCWSMFTFSRMLSLQIRLRVEGLTSKLNTVAQAKDFSSRIDDDGTDELGQAATAFNSLLAELQRAISATTRTVSAVAEGRFDTRIKEHFEGDLARLKEGVNQSSEKVDNTMAALAEVMRALAAGDFSARMDDRVEGAFKRQVDGAMQATESAINSVSHVIEAMSQGDFSARIEQDLPGSLDGLKNSVNDSLDNISAAMRDINECIQAQKVGRFSWRIRNQYQGELEVLKSGINDSMSSIDEALQDLNRIFRHIRRGDYSLRIDRQMHGDLAEMKDGVNASITELDAAISEIVNVAAAQQQGQLSARITGKYQGQLAELKESLNSSGATLNTTVDLISELMFKVKDGDFSGRIQLPMLGVFNDLKDAINESLAALQSAVRDLTEVATGQKKGELFRRMGRAHVGELAVIRDAVNASMSNLSDIVKQVQDSSSQTLNMTNEQSTATTEMSQRTEGQAAALQQIASTMQEIASAAGNTEKRCELISTEFNKAMQASEEGASTIENTVVSMTEMKDSSQKIANITGLIDEIAFQTNLLALNAAVEAARAGEQGRGFAVVAAEVRDLAQRSGSAARSIKELIEDNVSKVDNAWNLGQQSKKNLSHIYEILSNSAKLTKEVSQAAAEQNRGVQEINSAISSLDSMTQENAAMVEQTKAATMTVEEQSTRMHALLGFFVLQRAVQ